MIYGGTMLCPAGGLHDGGGSNFYSPPHLGEAVQVVAADIGAGERYAADIGGTTFEVVSIDPASGTVRRAVAAADILSRLVKLQHGTTLPG